MKAENESVEDYLETILILSTILPVVRAVDIATHLNYKNSSVSVALKNLKEKEYITATKQGYIYLTETGKAIADSIYERHQWFTNWLISLGIDESTASTDACKLEHAISKESFAAIKKAVDYEKKS